jgi:hypothetical protein
MLVASGRNRSVTICHGVNYNCPLRLAGQDVDLLLLL